MIPIPPTIPHPLSPLNRPQSTISGVPPAADADSPPSQSSTPVPYDPSKNVVSCKWIFRIKRKADESVDRYKARLVAKFTKRSGVDFHLTFSPVVKPTIVRIMLDVPFRFHWPLRQFDVNNAFLQAGFIFILVHVDDIIVIGSNPINVNKVIASVAYRLSIKDLGNLNYFLGVNVVRNTNDIILSQATYINEILNNKLMADCKSANTLMSVSELLKLNDGALLTDVTRCRRVLGRLQYLSFTRPDISYAVNKLSQFMQSPSDLHWKAVKRVLRYLHGTIKFGLRVSPNFDFNLCIYSNADWAKDLTDRSSISSYILFLDRNHISWSSKKQKNIARSSTEAEYRVVANALAELLWVRNLLLEMQIHVRHTPTIYCDNIGVTYLSENPGLHSRMKHIEVDFHFVCNHVE
uniref:Uncharacterized mitochondrial protein AtMg00810-like n=1 Tax=Nicotiana tabacum TaxID=4097 RepID=A0A1S3XXY0_TOBAC|nr:PREDICTED: uncharacterized mitochondrial protein AtMg00810-like [Nicotiana tabacum]